VIEPNPNVERNNAREEGRKDAELQYFESLSEGDWHVCSVPAGILLNIDEASSLLAKSLRSGRTLTSEERDAILQESRQEIRAELLEKHHSSKHRFFGQNISDAVEALKPLFGKGSQSLQDRPGDVPATMAEWRTKWAFHLLPQARAELDAILGKPNKERNL
jgi:hypothetical protein